MPNVLQIRPTYSLHCNEPPAELVEILLKHFADDEGEIVVRSVGKHLVLTVKHDSRHIWSPWLHLEVEDNEEVESGCRVSAKFSPSPGLWTSFAFGYFTFGSLLFFAAFFAVAQAVIGSSPWALWIAAITASGMVAMWITAKIGQQMANEQMHVLKNSLDEALAPRHKTHAEA